MKKVVLRSAGCPAPGQTGWESELHGLVEMSLLVGWSLD